MRKTLEDYDQIPEEVIRNSALTSGPGNPFIKLVEAADEWKAAGCTPVFIISNDRDENMMIACVSQETFGKLYN